jgi:hypothetical protein
MESKIVFQKYFFFYILDLRASLWNTSRPSSRGTTLMPFMRRSRRSSLTTLPRPFGCHPMRTFKEVKKVILKVNIDVIYEKAKKVIMDNLTKTIWVPSKPLKGVILGDNIDAIYDQVKKVIIDISTKTIWVPSNDNF